MTSNFKYSEPKLIIIRTSLVMFLKNGKNMHAVFVIAFFSSFIMIYGSLTYVLSCLKNVVLNFKKKFWIVKHEIIFMVVGLLLLGHRKWNNSCWNFLCTLFFIELLYLLNFQAVFKRTVTIEETLEVLFDGDQDQELSRGRNILNDFSSKWSRWWFRSAAK